MHSAFVHGAFSSTVDATTSPRTLTSCSTIALYDPDNPHGPMGVTRSMNAVRAELIRRGWT
jgi:hypothetical protein